MENKRGKGRPKGAYAEKYAQYGGVYAYRKLMAEQRRGKIEELMAIGVKGVILNVENESLIKSLSNFTGKSVSEIVNDCLGEYLRAKFAVKPQTR
jgi:hypothetical protein